MLSAWTILAAAAVYLGTLFAIAYYGDRRARAGRSIIANPYIYTLSIAVYCTAWTFYGSVGRAATTGVGFLPIYLGPTLTAALWWLVLRKILRITKEQRIISIADFIASRYGKSALLGGMVTVIAVVGILPYISLQLKAVSTSFLVIGEYPALIMPSEPGRFLAWEDTALWVALFLAAFTIWFGARHIDATERHEGLVAAIAFESLVKLVAFLAVGAFVTFWVFGGPADLFARAAERPHLAALMRLDAVSPGSWLSLTFLAMLAVLFLPRQFQVAVIENVNEDHLRKAVWLFPLYLLVINLFVLPLAFGGAMLFPEGGVDPDTYVLTVPMAQRREALALLVFLGGLAAATGMVIVATIALSTMVSNDLLMPLLLRIRVLRLTERRDLSGILLAIRRGAIVLVLLLGYGYFRLIGESYALVTIGLVSFCAAAQFAPAILLGIYWKGATRRGAIAGLGAGFAVWAYTLWLPAFARSGWASQDFVAHGLLGVELLEPYQLFGLSGLDPITHSVFWSMLANVGLLVGVSLFSRPSVIERFQAGVFVDALRAKRGGAADFWSGTATVDEIRALAVRFLGEPRAASAFSAYERRHRVRISGEADAHLVGFVERLLAGAIGAASARVMVSSVVKGEALSIEGVLEILDETSEVREYSRRLEEKSSELEAATEELRAANARLTELDRLKDEFVSMVSHELRTPLTSIRAFSEILRDNPAMALEQRRSFLAVVVGETERLTRLINEVLDLTKIESGQIEWDMQQVDARKVVDDAISAVSQLFGQRRIALHADLPPERACALADRDRLMQVIINLLSNAAKFCPEGTGRVEVSVIRGDGELEVAIADNGPGIAAEDQTRIFEKFHQVGDAQSGKPAGTGLGLTISRRIIDHHGGRIWVESVPGKGTTLRFVIPGARSG